jgi:uncharacterized protein (TIGR03663 family)
MLKSAFHFLVLALILVLAFLLRFNGIGDSPMHADEATGARILSNRLEQTDYKFDPTHFHGPLLTAVTVPIARGQGECDWVGLRASTLRWVSAWSGCFVVAFMLFWWKSLGGGVVILSMLFLATSPLLVTYSRIYIHEMLLAFASMTTLTFIILHISQPRMKYLVCVGIGAGLMFATKETVVISLLVWSLSYVLINIDREYGFQKIGLVFFHLKNWLKIGLILILFFISSAWFYSDGLKNISSIGDAYKTFFVYKTGWGHDKPWFYYLELLCWPKIIGARLWQETGVACVSLIGLFCMNAQKKCPHQKIQKFVLYSGLGHIFIYSLIKYKTPWLMVVPWMHLCIFAGIVVAKGIQRWPNLRIVIGLAMAGIFIMQTYQSDLATQRYSNDARNPYNYVPTSKDIVKFEEFIAQLSKNNIINVDSVVAVVGTNYWPLPWYLKIFHRIGYWEKATDVSSLQTLELVMAMPRSTQECSESLSLSHQSLIYGLRDEFPMTCYLRNDLWKKWMDLP